MNILITGGAGYIGTELIYALHQEEIIDQIVVYDNLSRGNYNLFLGKSKLKLEKVRYVKGDILDSYKLSKEIEMADIVFHLAAKVATPFADNNPHEFDQVNNWGTAELIHLVENSNITKFIYTSSASVYGASDNEVDIESPIFPKTFYGISKMHSEGHVKRLINSKIQTYILRLGNVYGYGKSIRFDSVINRFMFESNFSNRIRIFGDGKQIRSFININRLVVLLRNIALFSFEPGTYNLVESRFTINEIVDQLKLLYPSLEMIFINQNMKMRSLKVKPDFRISNLKLLEKNRLGIDLKEFKEHLSF